jgi:SAM-dependent methyltransferase
LIRQRHGVTVHELPIEEAPLADGGFGVVTFSHSLEHLRDPVQALRRTRQLLRPGGRVHVAVPNWRAAKRLAAGARIAWIYPGHVSYFTRATLQAALQRAGFAVAAARTLPMVCALDYRFAVAVTERWRCDGLVRRFLRLGDSGLSTLIGNDIVIACPVWRFRLVLALARLGLRLWPERLLGLFGCAEELRVTATAV